MAWDQDSMYHADTGHRTITEYRTDAAGVPIRQVPGQDIQGRVVLQVPESDGESDLFRGTQCTKRGRAFALRFHPVQKDRCKHAADDPRPCHNESYASKEGEK